MTLLDFPDLDDYFDPNLTLTIATIEYVIEPPSAADVIRIRRMFLDRDRRATGLDKLDWQARILGAEWDPEADEYVGPDDSVWQQMIINGVGAEAILRAGETALLRFGVNPDTAAVYWGPDDALTAKLDEALKAAEAGEAGKGPGSNRKRRRAAPKKTSSSKAGTGGSTRARAR